MKRSIGPWWRISASAIFRMNPGDKPGFHQVNKALVSILGYGSVEELLGVPVHRIYRKDADRKAFLAS